LLFQLFILGVFSCIPSSFLGSIFGSFFPDMEYMNYFQLFLYVLLVIALVEELCKWIVTYRLTYNHKEFDASFDMIVYTVFTSLGFACFENVLYVKEYGILIGILRGLLSVPGHACDGILMGIYLSSAKLFEVNGNIKLATRYKILSIIIPTFTHCIYDFCLFSENNYFILIFAVYVIFIDIICIYGLKKASKNSLKFKYRNKFCTNCGIRVDSNFCPQCGNDNR